MTALLAAGGSIDFTSIFLDLGVILVVAKVAAELEIGRASCRERVYSNV